MPARSVGGMTAWSRTHRNPICPHGRLLRWAGRFYGGSVQTVGVDLAAEAAGTAIARIDWSAAAAHVREVVVGADDDAVVDAIGRANTDEAVRDAIGRWPLSVAADRIGHTAMRAAALLARLADDGHAVDRRGAGVVVEVYPAASLHTWGLPYRGYKGPQNLSHLAELVDRLTTAAPWLDLGAHATLCRASDHAVDAVIAALTARAASQGLATQPGPDQAEAARTEGWIALPTASLNDLRPRHQIIGPATDTH